jgi:hypothetical protein
MHLNRLPDERIFEARLVRRVVERELARVELLADVRHESAERLLGLLAQPLVDENERALGVAAGEGEPRRRVAPVVLRLPGNVLRQR